jgi:hypothetical protein
VVVILAIRGDDELPLPTTGLWHQKGSQTVARKHVSLSSLVLLISRPRFEPTRRSAARGRQDAPGSWASYDERCRAVVAAEGPLRVVRQLQCVPERNRIRVVYSPGS